MHTMHAAAVMFTLGLANLATPSPVSTREAIPGDALQAESRGFTLVVKVTDLETDFASSINGYTLSTIHVGAGLALAGLYSDSARIWYVNGTEEEVYSDGKGTVISDGGTPPFPNGISLGPSENAVSPVRVEAGEGTRGVQLTTTPGSDIYLTAPTEGTYVACNESVPYYQDQKFLLLKYSESLDEGYNNTAQSGGPEGCAVIRLLPKCAELPDLPEGSLASHDFAREVRCYEDVAAIG